MTYFLNKKGDDKMTITEIEGAWEALVDAKKSYDEATEFSSRLDCLKKLKAEIQTLQTAIFKTLNG